MLGTNASSMLRWKTIANRYGGGGPPRTPPPVCLRQKGKLIIKNNTYLSHDASRFLRRGGRGRTYAEGEKDMLGKYDAWKLAYPPEWDRPQICEDCEQKVDECECEEEEEEEGEEEQEE